jgi:acyl dehydratase
VAPNPAYVGKTFEPSAPYEVNRVKIAEFATAIGEPSPLCFDTQAAQQAGYPDVIAPPTFAIVVSSAASAAAVRDPGLGINYTMVVHGEQSFVHTRPLHAGDVVIATSTIEEIRPIGKHTSMTMRTNIETVDGEHVCTARNTLVERGE